VFARAQQLVASGNGTAGRALVDSILAATPADTPEFVEALYWRATLAATTANAERDYRRIVVDYPVSPRSADALYQLAQLEIVRADRAAAAMHLQRFLLENPEHPNRGRAGYLLSQALFDQNERVRACIALARARRDVASDAVELRNQLDYLAPRCQGVDTMRTAAAADSAPAPDTLASRPATKRGRYAVQLGVYQTRRAADDNVKKLIAAGLDARLVGRAKPYRVRVGQFATAAEAAAMVKRLKTRGYFGVVTETKDER
jgi:cell division septation protein DedD